MQTQVHVKKQPPSVILRQYPLLKSHDLFEHLDRLLHLAISPVGHCELVLQYESIWVILRQCLHSRSRFHRLLNLTRFFHSQINRPDSLDLKSLLIKL